MKPSNVFSWKITFFAVALATLLILLIGWLVMSDVLPVKQVIEYSDLAAKFIKIWIWIALLLGIILPAIAFFVCLGDRQPRNVFGFYLLVCIIQLTSEGVFSQIWFPSIVVPVGTVYTAFRIWQLWQGQQLITATAQLESRKRTVLSALIWLLLCFWTLNLIMLSVLAWPTILQHN